MKKKSVNLITAVGVLVVLSGAYVGVKAYVAKQEAADTESAEEENLEIISIASADVKSIKFVIDLQPELQVLCQPFQFPVLNLQNFLRTQYL
jgi:hypothetical protein